jgi:hypothetical protein
MASTHQFLDQWFQKYALTEHGILPLKLSNGSLLPAFQKIKVNPFSFFLVLYISRDVTRNFGEVVT